MEGGQKPPLPTTSFFPVTSTKVGISPQHFLTSSLIKVLELPNFGHMTTSTVKFESRDRFLLMTS